MLTCQLHNALFSKESGRQLFSEFMGLRRLAGLAEQLSGWLADAQDTLTPCQIKNTMRNGRMDNTHLLKIKVDVQPCCFFASLLFSPFLARPVSLNSHSVGSYGTSPEWPLPDSCPMPRTTLSRDSLSPSSGFICIYVCIYVLLLHADYLRLEILSIQTPSKQT